MTTYHHVKRPLIVAFILTTIFTIIVSDGATVVPTKPVSTTPTATSPTLFLLSQAGDIAEYQTSGKRMWHISASSIAFSSSRSDGHTHLIRNGQTFYSATDIIQATTSRGRLLWQQSLSAPADDLLKVQQNLSVLSGTFVGTLSTWESTRGKLLWVQTGVALPFDPWAALKSDGHLLFLGGEDSVMALDVATGRIVWRDDLDPGDGAQQLFVERDILLLQTDSKILALQSATGTVLWQRDSHIQALSINAASTLVYTISIDVPDPVTHPNAPTWRGLRASDLATGKQLWAVEQPLFLTGASSISANEIVLSNTSSISAWDLHGKLLWQYLSAGSPLTQIKAVSQTGMDLIFAQDGTVVALNGQDGQQRWQQMFVGQAPQLTFFQQQYWIMSPADGEIAVYSTGGTKQWSLKLAPFEDIVMQ